MRTWLFPLLALVCLIGCSKDPVGNYYARDAEFLEEVNAILEPVESGESARAAVVEIHELMPQAAELKQSFDALMLASSFEPSEYRDEMLADRVEAFSLVLEQADRIRAKPMLWMTIDKPLSDLMAALGIVDWKTTK